MKILCKYNMPKPEVPASSLVNPLGKYIYKNLDGAFKFTKSPSMCDVYITVLYQLPWQKRIPGKGTEYNDVHEMTLNLNITTYSNKIRVNIIEVSPSEKTLSFKLYEPRQLMNLEDAKRRIFQDAAKVISKEYREYDFLF